MATRKSNKSTTDAIINAASIEELTDTLREFTAAGISQDAEDILDPETLAEIDAEFPDEKPDAGPFTCPFCTLEFSPEDFDAHHCLGDETDEDDSDADHLPQLEVSPRQQNDAKAAKAKAARKPSPVKSSKQTPAATATAEKPAKPDTLGVPAIVALVKQEGRVVRQALRKLAKSNPNDARLRVDEETGRYQFKSSAVVAAVGKLVAKQIDEDEKAAAQKSKK